MPLKMEEVDYKPKNVNAILEAGKGKEMDMPTYVPPEGVQPCWYFDSRAVKLISDF